MSKFDDQFCEPVSFSDSTYVVTGKISVEEAAASFSSCLGEGIKSNQLTADRVRFGFAPEFVEEMQGEPCWYTGAGKGRGTMPVWVFGKD